MPKIVVGNTSITVLRFKESDFISLTDIAKRKSDEPSVMHPVCQGRHYVEAVKK